MWYLPQAQVKAWPTSVGFKNGSPHRHTGDNGAVSTFFDELFSVDESVDKFLLSSLPFSSSSVAFGGASLSASCWSRCSDAWSRFGQACLIKAFVPTFRRTRLTPYRIPRCCLGMLIRLCRSLWVAGPSQDLTVGSRGYWRWPWLFLSCL